MLLLKSFKFKAALVKISLTVLGTDESACADPINPSSPWQAFCGLDQSIERKLQKSISGCETSSTMPYSQNSKLLAIMHIAVSYIAWHLLYPVVFTNKFTFFDEATVFFVQARAPN